MVAGSLAATGVRASLQGLYTLLPPSGQLALLNTTTGAATPVGQPLTAYGWVPSVDCSPSAIDTTGKWMYVLARNNTGDGPLAVVSLELADGSIRAANTLPDRLPATLSPCDIAFAADGTWHVYLAAAVGDSLVAYAYAFAPPYQEGFALVADVPTADLALGTPLPVPAAAVTYSTLWVALSDGLAGFSLGAAPTNATNVNGTLRSLPISSATPVAGLGFDHKSDNVTAVLLLTPAGDGATLSSFVDVGAGTPTLTPAGTGSGAGTPPLPPPTSPAAFALLTDKAALALLTSNNSVLVIAAATNGSLLSTAAVCSSPSLRSDAPSSCPLTLSYEHFVF